MPLKIMFCRIPCGSFMMGSDAGLPLEQPRRLVRIERPYFLSTHVITRGVWQAVMNANDHHGEPSPMLPAVDVSWDDAQQFCFTLSRSLGCIVRLPSEAEWEYACRAGSAAEYPFGNDERLLLEYAWFDLNSKSSLHEVGLKRPNAWGLFDMSGLVWEWCEDVWHSDYIGSPLGPEPREDQANSQPRRVLRGGSWNYDAFRCRSAYRSRDWHSFATDHFGFRIVLEPTSQMSD